MARDVVQNALLEAKRAREVAMENAKDVLIDLERKRGSKTVLPPSAPSPLLPPSAPTPRPGQARPGLARPWIFDGLEILENSIFPDPL